MSVRILLCDDHVVVRAGLLALLGSTPDIEVVGEAGSGEEAVAMAAKLKPDVVLMDLQLGAGIDGVEATRRIAPTGVHVLVLTTYDTDADITRAIEAGATGYLLKDAPRDELFTAVRAAAEGRTVLSPAVASRLVSRVRTPASPGGEQLSARERDVLELVAKGTSNKEIAAELFISEATVKTHLTHIFAKLGAKDRAAAVATAYDRGILGAS